MSGFSGFFDRLLTLFRSSTTRVIPVEEEPAQQPSPAPAPAPAPAQRNYLFTDGSTQNIPIPSLEFVLTGRFLPGENYRQDVHNYGTLNERNTIYQQQHGISYTYYYDPSDLESRYSERLSAIQGEAAAGGGSVRDDKLKAEKFLATQALEASNIARDLIRKSKLENQTKEQQEQESKNQKQESIQKCVFECPICYGDIDEKTDPNIILVCHNGHVFHSKCPGYNQIKDTKICPICRSEKLFKFKQTGGFKSIFKHIKKQKQSRKPKNRSDNQTRKHRKH